MALNRPCLLPWAPDGTVCTDIRKETPSPGQAGRDEEEGEVTQPTGATCMNICSVPVLC